MKGSGETGRENDNIDKERDEQTNDYIEGKQ
jgi:hypothetical protein